MYVLYERWKNVDALAAHLETDHLKKLLAALPELVEGNPDVEVLIPVGD
jgi:quinol monooxygenase YgiN